MANNIPPNEMLNANASIYQPQAAQPKIGGPQAHLGPNQQNANLQSLPHMAIRPGAAPFHSYLGPGPSRVASMQPPHRPQYATHPPPFGPNMVHQQSVAAAAAAASHRGNNSIHPNSQVTSASSHRGNSSMHHNSQVSATQQAQQAAAAAAAVAHQQAQHQHQAMANHQQQIHHQHQHANVPAGGISHRQNAAGGPGGGPPQMAAIPANRMQQMQYAYMPYQHQGHNPMQIYIPQGIPPHLMGQTHFAQFSPYQLELYQQQLQQQAQSARGYQQSQAPLMSNNIPPSEMMNPNAGVYQPQQSQQQQQPPPPQMQQQPQQQQQMQQGQQQQQQQQPPPQQQQQQPQSQPPPQQQIKYPEPRPLTHNKPRQMATVLDEHGNVIDLMKFQKPQKTPKPPPSTTAATTTNTTTITNNKASNNNNNNNQHSRSSSVSQESNNEEVHVTNATTTTKTAPVASAAAAATSEQQQKPAASVPSSAVAAEKTATAAADAKVISEQQQAQNSVAVAAATTATSAEESLKNNDKSATTTAATPPTFAAKSSSSSNRSRETTPLPPPTPEDGGDVKKTEIVASAAAAAAPTLAAVASGKASSNKQSAPEADKSLKTNDKSATTTTTPPAPAMSSSRSRETTPLPPPTTEGDGSDVKKVGASESATAASPSSSPSIAANGTSNKSAAAAAEEVESPKTNDKSATTTPTTTVTPPAPTTPARSSSSRASRETTPLPPPAEDGGDLTVAKAAVPAESSSPASSNSSSSTPSTATDSPASSGASPSIAANDTSSSSLNNKSGSAAEEEEDAKGAVVEGTTTSEATSGSVSANLSRNSSQNGPKVYEREELIALRERASDHAITLSNQENLKDIVKKPGNNKNHSQADMFMPSYAAGGGGGGGGRSNDSYRNKSQTQAIRRPSQPSKNYQDQKQRKITSTSMHYGETQYKPAANAWRPGQTKADNPVEAETEMLLKNVRAILNKLTPQNYHTLLEQFKALKIDSRNRLSRVIGLIFDKAVKEPSFVVQYAGFCSELVHIKVVETDEQGETVDVKFKNLLIEKCQETFFREMYSDIENFEERQREVEDCEDEKKKKELDDIMDDEKRLSRRRSIGNIKLIAELFKLNMLNARIMFSCIQTLLKHQHEEYVEVLCALITNIGANLTSAIRNKPSEQETFDDIFAKLTAIQRQEEGALKVSSRIRFTILDLLDLRKNNWVSRRKVEGPKTIAQVHEDMDQAERRKNMEAAEFNKKKRMNPNPDDWQQVNRSRGKSGASISQTKQLNVTSFNAMKDVLFANKPAMSAGSPFGAFAHGSHGGSSNSQSRNSSLNFDKGSNSTNSVQDGDKSEKPTETQMNAERLFELCMVGDSDTKSAKEKVLAGAPLELVQKTYRALVYKCVEYFMLKGKNDDITEKLVNIVSFCTNKQTELSLQDLLCISADVYRDRQFPQYGLTELLGVLFDNDVVSPKIIADCYQNGKFKNIVKLAFEKFFQAHNIKLPEQQQ